MNISCCTLTGVDEATDLDALVDLSSRFPIVEWGFLYSPQRQGRPGRYPSLVALRRALEQLPSHVRVALHLCGQGVPALLSGEPDATGLVEQVASRGGRLQLNFNQTRAPISLQALLALLDRYPEMTVITQYNQANLEVAPAMQGKANHAVLFDASGGRGVQPDRWPERLHGVACGYAGGLGPENLAEQLPRIAEAAGEVSTWIDMEGRLRIQDDSGVDRFSLARCAACLAVVSDFLASV